MGRPAAMPARSTLRAAALLAAVAMASAIEIPNIEAKHSYPKRSPDDSALLEWGNSAIIHNADGVVAKFGPGATHPEFELGIEADLVTATPRQGCEPLGNAALARTQIVVMYRGGCDFKTKAETAAAAGAAALIVVNNDRRSPDRAFAMSLYGDRERDDQIPGHDRRCEQEVGHHDPKPVVGNSAEGRTLRFGVAPRVGGASMADAQGEKRSDQRGGPEVNDARPRVGAFAGKTGTVRCCQRWSETIGVAFYIESVVFLGT